MTEWLRCIFFLTRGTKPSTFSLHFIKLYCRYMTIKIKPFLPPSWALFGLLGTNKSFFPIHLSEDKGFNKAMCLCLLVDISRPFLNLVMNPYLSRRYFYSGLSLFLRGLFSIEGTGYYLITRG